MGKKIACVAVALLTLVCYGTAFAIHVDTLVSPWLTGAFGMNAGLLLGIVMRRAVGRMTGFASSAANYVVAVVVSTGVALAALYAVNYFGAPATAAHDERVPVERLYTETHYHTKRISRGRYGRGEPYQVYFAEIRFADGRRKDISLRAGQYRRLHVGDSLNLCLEEGALGMTVLRRRGLRVDVPKRPRRH